MAMFTLKHFNGVIYFPEILNFFTITSLYFLSICEKELMANVIA